MKKDLPRLFANKIEKPLNNNEKVAVTKNEEVVVEEKKKSSMPFQKSIHQKINNIFESPKYVYKADVIITLKDKKITKQVVGKNQNNLITFDNELIPIADIIDIEFSNKSK